MEQKEKNAAEEVKNSGGKDYQNSSQTAKEAVSNNSTNTDATDDTNTDADDEAKRVAEMMAAAEGDAPVDEETKKMYGNMPIPKLFFKLFIPTFLGLLSGAIFEIADAVIAGRGVNSDALAATNISCPIWYTFTGIGLMFGVGVSVAAATSLAKGDVKAANRYVSNAFAAACLISGILLFFIMAFPHKVNDILDGSEELAPYLADYLRAIGLGFFGTVINYMALFVIRLDGAVKYAMYTNAIPAFLNIALNGVMVYSIGMGVEGIGLASSIAECTGVVMVIIYFTKFSKTIHVSLPKFSFDKIKSMMRDAGHMMTLGFSTFLGETALSGFFLVGNYMFEKDLQEPGVAAFSVACALLPMVFMFGNAAVQSAIPIISYNHGLGKVGRIKQTIFISIITVIVFGLISTIAVAVFHGPIVHAFIGHDDTTFELATKGLPAFATCFTLFALNLLFIGFYQSFENVKGSVTLMLLRGYIILVPVFLFLPSLIGIKGHWLALPLSEMLTLIIILIDFTMNFFKRENLIEAEKAEAKAAE